MSGIVKVACLAFLALVVAVGISKVHLGDGDPCGRNHWDRLSFSEQQVGYQGDYSLFHTGCQLANVDKANHRSGQQ